MTDRKSLGGLALLALSFTGLALHGCSSGPLSPLAPLNPALRKQWSEDESYGLMFRQRMEGIDALAQQAPRMAPADAAQTAVQMTNLVQSDPNPLIRRAAVGALGNFPAPVGDAGLAAAMNDEVTPVRVAACRAWGQRQDATALQSLARALENDEDADVKLAAAHALRNFRDPAAIQALGVALKSPDPALQVRAMASLKAVSGQDLGGDVQAWQQYVQSGQPPKSRQPTLAERWRSLF